MRTTCAHKDKIKYEDHEGLMTQSCTTWLHGESAGRVARPSCGRGWIRRHVTGLHTFTNVPHSRFAAVSSSLWGQSGARAAGSIRLPSVRFLKSRP